MPSPQPRSRICFLPDEDRKWTHEGTQNAEHPPPFHDINVGLLQIVPAEFSLGPVGFCKISHNTSKNRKATGFTPWPSGYSIEYYR